MDEVAPPSAQIIMAAEMIEISNDIVLECIFCCLDARTLFRCARVCRRWNEVLQPGDSKIWRSCFSSMESDQYLDEFTGSKLVRTCLPNDKARVRAFLCTWTEKDSSDNLYVKEDRITTHRNPVGKSTDSIRTNVGFEYGRHHFVMVFSGHAFGTNAMMGVCTKEAPLRVRRYDNLLGMSRYAWGWDLVNNKLLHNNEEHDTVEVCSIT